jgi:signal transduction histidine kinase
VSTALLRFQQPGDGEEASSLAVIAAALDVCPETFAIAENGKIIYRNHSFEEIYGPADQLVSIASSSNFTSHHTDFALDGRNFQLLTGTGRMLETNSDHLMLVGRLVSGVAHDFNNLLTGILLYCDLMEGKVAPSDSLARKIEEIRVAAEQGAGLIRQLMMVGREEKDAPQYVEFNQTVKEFFPLLRHLIGENFHVSTELDACAALIGISGAQAQQIILNLLLNARDAMPEGGQIWLKTASRLFETNGSTRRYLELTVRDCGAGMDPQTASRIFDPFFTTKAPGHGTGMGLATVSRIIEKAAGMISVESGRGEGTQITVRLPEIEASEANDQATALEADRCSKSTNAKRGAEL